MFIVCHAGFYYGPFATAGEAATFAENSKIMGPWTIVKLWAKRAENPPPPPDDRGVTKQ